VGGGGFCNQRYHVWCTYIYIDVHTLMFHVHISICTHTDVWCTYIYMWFWNQRYHVWCTYIYVCSMHACMLCDAHISMRVLMHTCMYVWMYACMYAYACMYMHVCMYACMHVCMYACMHVCMYALCTWWQLVAMSSNPVLICDDSIPLSSWKINKTNK